MGKITVLQENSDQELVANHSPGFTFNFNVPQQTEIIQIAS